MDAAYRHQQTHQARGRADPAAGLLSAANPMTNAMSAIPPGAKALEPSLRLAAEILSFTGRRLLAQSEHMLAASKCSSLPELHRLNSLYMAQLFSDYQSGISEITNRISDASTPPAPKAST
ncbi:hypothetical protein [Methylobacterium sp. ID0610]|uniref:hypothetical protein n=1 Tax=Methylobacterium carpenticola TaxID=3344827 RepID=UPI0036AEE313